MRDEVITVTAQELLGVLGVWRVVCTVSASFKANVKVALNKVSKRSSNLSPVCQIQKGAGDVSGGEENTKTQALYIDIRVKVATLECSVFLSQ